MKIFITCNSEPKEIQEERFTLTLWFSHVFPIVNHQKLPLARYPAVTARSNDALPTEAIITSGVCFEFVTFRGECHIQCKTQFYRSSCFNLQPNPKIYCIAPLKNINNQVSSLTIPTNISSSSLIFLVRLLCEKPFHTYFKSKTHYCPIKRGEEQGNPFSLLSEPVSPSSLLIQVHPVQLSLYSQLFFFSLLPTFSPYVFPLFLPPPNFFRAISPSSLFCSSPLN